MWHLAQLIPNYTVKPNEQKVGNGNVSNHSILFNPKKDSKGQDEDVSIYHK